MYSYISKSGSVLILFTLSLAVAIAQPDDFTIANSCIPCSEIKDLRLPDVTILEATAVNTESAELKTSDKADCKI